ncbi:MAG: replication-relaxation family protein [Gemmataceae bacterium]
MSITTERDIGVLLDIDRYSVMSTPQIRRRRFPNDPDGRVTRRRLQHLKANGLVNRMTSYIHCTSGGPASSLYYPSRKGGELLAAHFGDVRFLATNTQAPPAHYAWHWQELTDVHMTLDDAIAAQNEVELLGWINEFDIVNKDETLPEKRYRLFTLLREAPHRLVCAPDCACLVAIDGESKILLWEIDRATSGAKQEAISKPPGYAELANRNLQRRFFPQATVPGFTVVVVSPTAKRRDLLRQLFREVERADMWRFAAKPELTATATTILFEPVFYPCEGAPAPLIVR